MFDLYRQIPCDSYRLRCDRKKNNDIYSKITRELPRINVLADVQGKTAGFNIEVTTGRFK